MQVLMVNYVTCPSFLVMCDVFFEYSVREGFVH